MFVKIPNIDLVLNEPSSFLTADTAAGVTTINVKNLTGFTTNQTLIIGILGNQGTEIVKTHASTPPASGVITLAAATIFPHSSSTAIVAIAYDQVEISSALTTTGSKTVLTTTNVQVDSETTNYNDTTNASGYYFARFYNTISTLFSGYSDPIPVNGYTLKSARKIIDNALGMISKTTSEQFSDSYAFAQIDECQNECVLDLKRWSFLQKFNYNMGDVSTGQWKIALPTDCADQNTTKSIYNFRIGKGNNLRWVDKEKWNEIIQDVASTTLSVSIILGATTITLTDSSDFNDTGTITIGANTYSYSANSRSTGVLTTTATTTTNSSGTDVFQSATNGMPEYWTTYGGYIYWYPIIGPTYNGRNAVLDYYSALLPTTTDTQEIVLPDPTVVTYYLAWKFLLRQANGITTNAIEKMWDKFDQRRKTMKQKESINRTFQLKPLLNRFNMNNDSPAVRLGNFL